MDNFLVLHVNYYSIKDSIASEICLAMIKNKKIQNVYQYLINPTADEKMIIENNENNELIKQQLKETYIYLPHKPQYQHIITSAVTLDKFFQIIKNLNINFQQFKLFSGKFQVDKNIIKKSIDLIKCSLQEQNFTQLSFNEDNCCQFHSDRIQQIRTSQNSNNIQLKCSQEIVFRIANSLLEVFHINQFNIILVGQKFNQLKQSCFNILKKYNTGQYLFKHIGDNAIAGLFIDAEEQLSQAQIEQLLQYEIQCYLDNNLFCNNDEEKVQMLINEIQFQQMYQYSCSDNSVAQKKEKIKIFKRKLPDKFQNIIVLDFEAYITEPPLASEVCAVRIENNKAVALLHCFLQPSIEQINIVTQNPKYSKTCQFIYENISRIPLPNDPQYQQIDQQTILTYQQFNDIFQNFCLNDITTISQLIIDIKCQKIIRLFDKNISKQNIGDTILCSKDISLEYRILKIALKNDLSEKLYEVNDVIYHIFKEKPKYDDIHSIREYNYCQFHQKDFQLRNHQKIENTETKKNETVHCALDDVVYLTSKIIGQPLKYQQIQQQEIHILQQQQQTPDFFVIAQRKDKLKHLRDMFKQRTKQLFSYSETSKYNSHYAIFTFQNKLDLDLKKKLLEYQNKDKYNYKSLKIMMLDKDYLTQKDYDTIINKYQVIFNNQHQSVVIREPSKQMSVPRISKRVNNFVFFMSNYQVFDDRSISINEISLIRYQDMVAVLQAQICFDNAKLENKHDLIKLYECLLTLFSESSQNIKRMEWSGQHIIFWEFGKLQINNVLLVMVDIFNQQTEILEYLQINLNTIKISAFYQQRLSKQFQLAHYQHKLNNKQYCCKDVLNCINEETILLTSNNSNTQIQMESSMEE